MSNYSILTHTCMTETWPAHCGPPWALVQSWQWAAHPLNPTSRHPGIGKSLESSPQCSTRFKNCPAPSASIVCAESISILVGMRIILGWKGDSTGEGLPSTLRQCKMDDVTVSSKIRPSQASRLNTQEGKLQVAFIWRMRSLCSIQPLLHLNGPSVRLRARNPVLACQFPNQLLSRAWGLAMLMISFVLWMNVR